MSSQWTPTAEEALSQVGPVKRQDRIELLDVLRGFALFGILLVNMVSFGLPEGLYPHEFWPGLIDVAAEKLILFFGFGKFVTLFSFLFGVGFAVQLSRVEARGARFVPMYLRRLLVLMAIGTAHMILVWDGDILHVYAVGGLLLLLFRKRSPKTLLVWAALSLMLLAVPFTLITAFTAVRQVHPNAWSGVVIDDDRESDQQAARNALAIYSQGTYRQMVELRSQDMPWALVLDEALPYVVAIFLIGLYAGRSAVFQNMEAHLPWIRRTRWWALGIGIAGNLAVAAAPYQGISATEVLPNLSLLSVLFAAPAMSLFYASIIVLLAQQEKWRTRFLPLACMGRMALTNYLLQSLICTTIFNSYGLDLYGKVRPSLGLILTLLIYMVQIPLSVWWLRRFQFGPAEWLWRTATYASLQPMRKA